MEGPKYIEPENQPLLEADDLFETLLNNPPLPPNTILFGVEEVHGVAEDASPEKIADEVLLHFLRMCMKKFDVKNIGNISPDALTTIRSYFRSLHWDFRLVKNDHIRTVVDYGMDGVPFLKDILLQEERIEFFRNSIDPINVL